MKSLPVSREVIGNLVVGFDGVVAIGGCDKNMPGCLIGLARLNRPAVFEQGGTILPGCLTTGACHWDDPTQKKLDTGSIFKAIGGHAVGDISDDELREVEEKAIPIPGSWAEAMPVRLLSWAK